MENDQNNKEIIETEEYPKLMVSEDVEQTLINLYAPLMAIYYEQIDMVNEIYANNIANFMQDIHPEQYRAWPISDTGKRLKSYDFLGHEDSHFIIQDEWMEKIKNDLFNKERKNYPDLTNWDIDWWNSMTDDEKLAILTVDFVVWGGAFNDYREKNRPEYNYETTENLRTWFPCFGNPEGGRDCGDRDRPLPLELLKTISDYVLRRWNEDKDKTIFIREIRGVGNFNVFIREKIEAGEL
uniref:Uncharacterized protein n=1 Tax=candidate division CPR3 bacterium TaxID=2268181 RepID=A0A7C4RAF8_UNCC3